MKSELTLPSQNSHNVFKERQQSADSTLSAQILDHLNGLKQANKETLPLVINAFLPFIEKTNVVNQLDSPKLRRFWEDVFHQQAVLLQETKLSLSPPQRLVHLSPFKQLLGYYYYHFSIRPQGKSLLFLEKAVFYQNPLAAKMLARHWINGIQSDSYDLGAIYPEIQKKVDTFLPLKTLGYLLAGQILKNMATVMIKETRGDSLGWQIFGEAIRYLHVANLLAKHPDSQAILKNAYGTDDLTLICQNSESPLMNFKEKNHHSLNDFITDLVTLYKRTGWPTEDLLSSAKKHVESISDEKATVSPSETCLKETSEPEDWRTVVNTLFSQPSISTEFCV